MRRRARRTLQFTCRPHVQTPDSTGGFSLVELVIALAITLALTAAVFALVGPANGAFQTQPEAADVQQRLRAATDALSRDLLVAGSTPYVAQGPDQTTPLPAAAVFSMRVGRISPDTAGTVNPARIAVWSVSPTAPQARLASPLASASGVATFVPGAGCRSGAPSCGFQTGTTAIVFGGSGAWDIFSITSVAGSALTLQHNLRDAPLVHPAAESTIAEAAVRTYMLKDDPASGFARLVRYEAAGGSDVPVIDHLVDLQFQYLGEGEPPTPVLGTDPVAPRVTYGPSPPPPGTQLSSYPPGENCAFARTPSGAVTPRLAALSAGPVLVPLSAASLADGPWCPDSLNPNRYDADLLRVREIVATIRVEAALDSLRGPAGPLFSRGGTARGTRMVPDRSARLVLAPRSLNLWR